MGLFGRKGPEGVLEKRDRKPISVVKINFARHSFKGKTPEGREPITEQGMKAAAEEGQKLGYYNDVVEKVTKGEKLDVASSLKERATESGMFRLLGEQLKDVDFKNLDPLEFVKWIEKGGNFNKTETILLDFGLGDPKGKYFEETMKNAKANNYMPWAVKESDALAISEHEDPEKASTFSTQAGNVAGFIWALGVGKSKELKEDKKESDFAFATSHGGVLESFLYKVIKGKESEDAANKFVESLGVGQFSENAGFEGEFRTFSEAEDDFDAIINYNGKVYEVPPELIKQIMTEGMEQRLKMEIAKNGKEEKKEEKK